jgi:hypothetical protein
MFAFNRLTRTAAACAVLALAAAPQLAAAQSSQDYRDAPPPNGQSYGGQSYGDQSYGDQSYQGSYDDDRAAYDACRQHKTNNAVGGAIVGGLLGAVVGSQVSGHGARTEGSVIGGGGGAIAGAAIGSSSTNCTPPPQADYRSDDRGQDNGGQGYQGQDSRGAGDDRDYAQGGPPDPGQGCDWADSTVYMPDGTTQKHLVHVCQDARGHYQVVN